ncbi:MAG: GHKL domain-containing protein [Desulfobulbaceae bacterium]|nr:GHKL domain-containing protein [Desulfobulbaceae bacterium]
MISLMKKQNIKKISVITLLVIGITTLHYQTDHLKILNHIFFRELYFLPIILAGFWFGIYGGIGASLFVTFLYLPFVLSLPEVITGHNFGNLVEIVLFNIFGLVFGLLRDRQTRQQQRLLEAESLAAMGRAVSCIAHDMKTPLLAIGGFVQQVRCKVADDKLAKKLDIAFGQVQRLEMLIGDMLAFAKPLHLQRQQGMINSLIEEVVMVSGEKASRHAVTIMTKLQQDLPVIKYDQHRLQQALQNLLNNALEASPNGSEVIIRSKRQGDGISIEIADMGEGIPTKQQSDIFTPFVTTKKEGTGLGLSIVKKVIEAHNGSIDVTENSEKGVTFRITIPLTYG